MNRPESTTSVNAASADARTDESPVSNPPATQTSENNKPQNKRFRSSGPTRRGGAAYDQIKHISSLNIVPRLPIFPIFVSNHGCESLSTLIYDVIRAKDYRLAQNLTLDDLKYSTHLAFLNRIVQCATRNGYSFPPEASLLKQVSQGIQLPSVLASYIEAIGLVTLSSSAVVAPWCGDYPSMFPHDSTLNTDFARYTQAEEHQGHWPIDTEIVCRYNASTTRASRSGMNFRSVNNDDLTGRYEMLVSYTVVGDMLLPKAPQVMTAAEAQLGACYRFRNYTEREVWFGANKELLFDAFTSIPIQPRMVFNDVCVAAFKGLQITTQ